MLPGGTVLPREVRQRAQAGVSGRAALRYNGWKRLLVMVGGVAAMNVCVLLPLYFVFRRALESLILPRWTVQPLVAGGGLRSFGWMIAAMLGWMVVVMGVTLAANLPFFRWYWNPVIVAAVLRAGHCAACGYAMPQDAVEEGGCTICPECGAAWRLPLLSGGS